MILYYNQCEVIYLKKEFFPDGTFIVPWFYDTTMPAPGKKYVLKAEPCELCTEKIQSLIDTAHSCGGGTVVIPEGTYYSGALFFKDGVNLFIEKGGVLKGSFNISDYIFFGAHQRVARPRVRHFRRRNYRRERRELMARVLASEKVEPGLHE